MWKFHNNRLSLWLFASGFILLCSLDGSEAVFGGINVSSASNLFPAYNLIFTEKNLNFFSYNGTTLSIAGIAGNFILVGLGAWLLSFLPQRAFGGGLLNRNADDYDNYVDYDEIFRKRTGELDLNDDELYARSNGGGRPKRRQGGSFENSMFSRLMSTVNYPMRRFMNTYAYIYNFYSDYWRNSLNGGITNKRRRVAQNRQDDLHRRQGASSSDVDEMMMDDKSKSSLAKYPSYDYDYGTESLYDAYETMSKNKERQRNKKLQK